MQTSETIGKLVGALAKATLEFGAVAKDRTGQVGGGRYRYATLESVMAATTEALARHDVVVVQTVSAPDGVVTVTTMLAHSSGEWMRSESTGPDRVQASKALSAVQEAGKEITYLRRYALTAILGVTAEEDTDGRKEPPRSQRREPATQPEPSQRRESPEDREQRQAKHDPSWAGDRARTAAHLRDLGTDIDEASALLVGLAKPRPRLSHMDQGTRNKALAWLASKDGAAALSAHRDAVDAAHDAAELAAKQSEVAP